MLRLNLRSSLVAASALAVAACGGGGNQTADSNSVASESAGQATPAAAADLPDACTLFPREELEATVGWELRDGEPKDASAGSSCSFEGQPAAYARRTFPNPALPASVGFSSLTVTVHPAAADTFAEGQKHPGNEVVPGLGDDAYFEGSNFLHVRVGGKGFSVRIYTDATSAADAAKVRDVMMKLGQTGAARMK